jgi:hypothetical protein
MQRQPITVAARSKAWTIFARSNTGIVGSNPTQGMDVCLVYSVFMLSCVGSGLAMGWSPVQGVLPTGLGLRNWSETKRFTDVLCSKWEQQRGGGGIDFKAWPIGALAKTLEWKHVRKSPIRVSDVIRICYETLVELISIWLVHFLDLKRTTVRWKVL